MNCKPGDLAILMRSVRGNAGRLVEVVEFAGFERFKSGRESSEVWRCIGVGWHMEGEKNHGYGYVPNVDLRPLRDPGDDAVDETLGWLPVPSKEIQHAMDDLCAHIAQGAREKAGAA